MAEAIDLLRKKKWKTSESIVTLSGLNINAVND